MSTSALPLHSTFIFKVECNALVGMTLIRPLNKGQGHSFWYNRFLKRLGSQ